MKENVAGTIVEAGQGSIGVLRTAARRLPVARRVAGQVLNLCGRLFTPPLIGHLVTGTFTTMIDRWRGWMSRDDRIKGALLVLAIFPVGIDRLADRKDEVARRFKDLARALHPDKARSNAGANHIVNLQNARDELVKEIDWHNKQLLQKVGSWAWDIGKNTCNSALGIFSIAANAGRGLWNWARGGATNNAGAVVPARRSWWPW